MILRVIAYGDPLLRKQSDDIDKNYPELKELISNMFETMYSSNGVGLAAPQIGLNINLFVIDTTQIENFEKGVKKVFINPQLKLISGKFWKYEEGCLSLPKIRENVEREEKVIINYLDENFKEQEEEYDEINARVILHEYDHLEGLLFIDKISPLRKRMIRKKLEDIKTGTVDVDYPMKFYKKVRS